MFAFKGPKTNQFYWTSGALDAALSWSQPDPHYTVPPGANDIASFAMSGKLTGSQSALQVTFGTNLDLAGSITTSGIAALAIGPLAIGAGASLNANGLKLMGGSLT
jgi:hypothetical protein